MNYKVVVLAGMAEWSKAVDSSSTTKVRGFEPHFLQKFIRYYVSYKLCFFVKI